MYCVDMDIIFHWLVSTFVIAITAYILPSAQISSFGVAVLAALVLGLVNAFIRPFLVLITLPINVVTLGLFTLVINALMIMLTSAIVPGFRIDGFWSALVFGIVMAVVGYIVSLIITY